MPATSAAHFINELRDLLLLRVPSSRLPVIEADVSSAQPTLLLEWSSEDDSLPPTVESVIDTLSHRYPNVAIGQPTLSYSDHDRQCLEVVATEVEAETPAELPEDMSEGDGEPIPSDTSFPVSINVGDVAFDVVSYDGMTYTLLRDGETVEAELPSVAAAVGALLGYVLPEIAHHEAQKGTPHPDTEVDKDFLFSISQFLRNSPIIPDDSIRKHLVDFVELTTHRDFNAK
jgi:hypothetical protein